MHTADRCDVLVYCMLLALALMLLLLLLLLLARHAPRALSAHPSAHEPR
jgi:IS4 transposase